MDFYKQDGQYRSGKRRSCRVGLWIGLLVTLVVFILIAGASKTGGKGVGDRSGNGSRYACEMVKAHAAGVLYGLQSTLKTSGDVTPESLRALAMVRTWMRVLGEEEAAASQDLRESRICGPDGVLPKLTGEIMKKNPGVSVEQASVVALSLLVDKLGRGAKEPLKRTD